ncbi:hypothetical protein LJ739_08360 [Aestuariibacter halophilus]|uniref:Uncharacterized protein n=1 Tax=Fluctibacter halophilus TaxID=226011 RepID=A0ABS8G6S4_9ALTE|nr:hypothetical protein [Aestuariibacter halophilus]MCC2616250.1 hypothetical protein [Aestuariibacter halophilus]
MKSTKKIEDMGRQTLRAGAGAVEHSRDIAADKTDALYENGLELLQSLISRGEKVESALLEKLKVPAMIEDKIAALKAKLGFNGSTREQNLDILSAKVDALIEVVATLAEKKAAEEKAAKAAASKVTAAKTAKATTKSTATKASTTKATTRKSTTSKTSSSKSTTSAKKPASTTSRTRKSTTGTNKTSQ